MLTLSEAVGKVLAQLFQPAAPLLSLVFALALMWRRLHDYWIVAFYFLVYSLHGAFAFFTNLEELPAAYICFRSLEAILMGIIAWQLGRRSFVSYPSLAAFATRALWILLPLCLILAFVTVLTDPPLPPDRHPKLQLMFAIERAISTVILTFLLAVGAFAGWFPVRMKQNSARLLIGFMVLQAYRWIFLLAANTRWQWTYWVAFWGGFVIVEVLLYWMITLKPAGEVAVASTVPRWDPDRMTALNGQLEQIHSQLARRGY
jgi:hypothetical protein